VIGQKLLHYRIVEHLGSGGMGEVYRAKDEKLNRDVALKVLPEGTLSDDQARKRFRKEANALSRLAHPHVAAIHDFDSESGTDFLVMELVPGPSIGEELRRGPFAEKDVVRLGAQIARGLQAAHEQGVVHRDLKPSNLRLTSDGLLKILDFGVARLEARAGGDVGDATATETADGQVVGTLPYMAPEQLLGRPVDARADVYGIGAVLYEMVAARRPHGDATGATLVSAILHEEPPPLRSQRPEVSPDLERVIVKALDKDPELRYQTAREMLVDLERLHQRTLPHDSSVDAGSAGGHDRGELGIASQVPSRRGERLAWTALVLVLATLVSFLMWRRAPGTPPPKVVRFKIDTPALLAQDNLDAAVSPDGRQIAFSPWSAQGSVWLRSLDETTARRLPGTEGGNSAFWRPDGKALAFFGYGERGQIVLNRVDLASGEVRTICAVAGGFWGGGTWNEEGRILFSTGDQGERFRIHAVSADGGEPDVLLDLDEAKQERGHTRPRFLPDGRRFLFTVESVVPGVSGIWLSSVDRPEHREMILPDAAGDYTGGHLLFEVAGRPRELMARPFDPERAEVSGQATTVVSGLAWPGAWSAGGDVLAYVEQRRPLELAWFDREGVKLETVGAPARYGYLELSPDGRRAAVAIQTQGNADVWTLDVERGVPTRVTSDPAGDINVVWSPDGGELFFSSDRGDEGNVFLHVGLSPWQVYRTRPDGSGPAAPLPQTPHNAFPKDVTPDGMELLVVAGGPPANDSIWALPLTGDGEPELVLKTPYGIDDPRISPDGRWLVYIANETGRWEVYVRPFRREGEKKRVSSVGGRQPRWRGDGEELFYLTPQGELTAVAVREAGTGLELGPPHALFGAGIRSRFSSEYAVAKDGQRFLVITPGDAPTGSLNVVANWPALLD